MDGTNMTKTNRIKSLVELVHELEENGHTFVAFVDVTAFLLLCKAVGILANGGAFSSDMTGQYFYI